MHVRSPVTRKCPNDENFGGSGLRWLDEESSHFLSSASTLPLLEDRYF